MDRLWGDVRPVPEGNLHILTGGERFEGFRVEYTPGHASHHVSYLHEATGEAFVGDTAGVRIPPRGPTIPPTPPPDIDLEAWAASIDIVEAWRPTALCATHFGRHPDVAFQLADLREGLARFSEAARSHDEGGFIDYLREEIAAYVGEDEVAHYVQAAPPDQLYKGLERYWRKRVEREEAERAEAPSAVPVSGGASEAAS
jgi:glyoxylase-like metal-dependent hydrolase (beta-lactamase superfamily II)